MKSQLPQHAQRLTCGNDRIRGSKEPRRRVQPSRGMADLREQTDMANRTCDVPGCERPPKCRGWCRSHYDRWRRTGSPGTAPVGEYGRTDCSVEGCEQPHLARGYCTVHYDRVKRTGTPGTATIRAYDSGRTCSIDGCEIKASGHGMCRTHWARKWRGGSPGDAYIKHLTDPAARNEAGEKRCPSCKTWRPLADYTKSAFTPDELYKRCRLCTRAATLWKSYKLTLDAYDALLEKQGGGCCICSSRPDGPYSLHVDHDHACCSGGEASCGKCVRGLLCSPCNTALGLLADDPRRFRAAAQYLERRRD